MIERVVASEGLELVGWELKGEGSKAMLRITIDNDEGVTHEHCVAVNNQVGTILEVEDLIPFGYTLEITSPGLGKGLVGQPAFDRHRGETVRIRTSQPLENRTSFKGRIEKVTPTGVVLVDRQGQEHQIQYSQMFAANTVHAPARAGRRPETGGQQ
ncbi:MAG TPA: ribosome maturation factor RimP [Blastocatellia bacterium]|nr:ribosome maturation factor RimP [Blastocatellia bacterium]